MKPNGFAIDADETDNGAADDDADADANADVDVEVTSMSLSAIEKEDGSMNERSFSASSASFLASSILSFHFSSLCFCCLINLSRSLSCISLTRILICCSHSLAFSFANCA